MSLTSEQVHLIYGAALIAATSPMLVSALGRFRGRWIDFVPVAAMLVAGVEMIIDPLIHGAALPSNYGVEMMQHYALGGVFLAGALLEFFRVQGKRKGWGWRAPMTLVLAVAAALFAFHAQHGDPSGAVLLTTQHRMFAATLGGAAIAFLAEDQIGAERRPLAFPLVMLIFGLQLLVYTEQGAMVMHGGH